MSISEKEKERDIQDPAAESGGGTNATFCLYRLSQSLPSRNHFITLKICQTICKEGRKMKVKHGHAYSNLNFVCVELRLDGSESSQLSKLDKKRREGGIWDKTDTTMAYVYEDNIWVTAHYSLDSPNQPANHEAPERDHYDFRGFIKQCKLLWHTHTQVIWQLLCVSHTCSAEPLRLCYNTGDKELICLSARTWLWTVNKWLIRRCVY